MTGLPIPTGAFTWTSAGAWATFLAIVGVVIRQIGPWRKLSIDAEQTFREGLVKRVEKLEETLNQERVDRRVERERIEAERDADRRHYEAEAAVNRHKLNNVTQCLDALLLMLEAAPEKAPEIVSRIKQMRADQVKAEALEKATIHAARIQDAQT